MKSNLSTIILIVLLAIAAVALGYNYFFQPILKRWQASQPTNEMLVPRQALGGDAGQDLKNGLVASLSAQDKIAQLLVIPVTSYTSSSAASGSAATATALAAKPVLDAETQAWIKTYKPGFVQLVGSKTSSTSATLQPLTLATATLTTQALDTVAAAMPWPPLKLVRHSSGDTQVLRGTGFVKLPTMAQLCTDAEKSEPILARSATELANLKIAMVIGPVVDLHSSSGFQAGQLCADDARATVAAQKYIESFGSQGILPVVAHFPGIGQATQNPQTKQQTLPVTVSELKPFQQLLKTYPNIGVLVSPVAVSGKFGDKACVLSADCLSSFGQDYPQILVVADSLPARTLSVAETIKQSLLAGNHVVVLDSRVSLPELTTALQDLTKEYAQNEAFKAAVDRGWRHVSAVRTGKTS